MAKQSVLQQRLATRIMIGRIRRTWPFRARHVKLPIVMLKKTSESLSKKQSIGKEDLHVPRGDGLLNQSYFA